MTRAEMACVVLAGHGVWPSFGESSDTSNVKRWVSQALLVVDEVLRQTGELADLPKCKSGPGYGGPSR